MTAADGLSLRLRGHTAILDGVRIAYFFAMIPLILIAGISCYYCNKIVTNYCSSKSVNVFHCFVRLRTNEDRPTETV